MPILQSQKDDAKVIQDNIAHDTNEQIRLLTGPGTGKSFVIEERFLCKKV